MKAIFMLAMPVPKVALGTTKSQLPVIGFKA
jgi:hypothetical protein